jgi:hypothetical protein
MPTPYPFDPTGAQLSNKIVGEQHVLTAMNFQDYFFVVPTFAPFFLDGLTVVHTALDNSTTTLVEGVDYIATHLFIGASRACALPIYGSITFLNLSLAGQVTLQYQTLGGEWTVDLAQIAEILADRIHNPRVTAWEQVSGAPNVFPVVDHPWDLVDMVGLSEVLPKLDDIATAIVNKTTTGLAAHLAATNPHGITPAMINAYSKTEVDSLIAAVNAGASPATVTTMINNALASHVAASDPHPVYATDTDLSNVVANAVQLAAVRKPTIVVPAAEQVFGANSFTIQGSPYYPLYPVLQAASEFQISTVVNFATVVFDSTLGAVQSVDIASGTLSANAFYYCRCRYQDAEGNWSAWSDPIHFKTGSSAVATPSITAPSNGATNQSLTALSLTSSAFAMTSGSDTHLKSDWEIWTGPSGTGTLAFSSYADSDDLTSIAIPTGTLVGSTQYYPRVRYYGVSTGASNWSANVSFTTQAPVSVSGTPGDAYGGGYLAGFIVDAGTRYAIIVSPRALGSFESRAYRMSNRGSVTVAGATSLTNGRQNTDLMVAAGSNYYPAAIHARSLVINGYSDWYIPARDELELLYHYFKPYASSNSTGSRYDGGQRCERQCGPGNRGVLQYSTWSNSNCCVSEQRRRRRFGIHRLQRHHGFQHLR